MEWILQPWPWWVSGPLIGLTVPLLLLLTGKTFGISSSFRNLNAICFPNSQIAYLRLYSWREHGWNLLLVLGVVIGGFIGNHLLSETPVAFLPESYSTLGGIGRLLVGGMLVGFGTRYANGCTSGHTIMGLANLRWVSLVATIFFFVGGLLTTHVFLTLLGG